MAEPVDYLPLVKRRGTGRKIKSYWPVADYGDDRNGHGSHVVGSITGYCQDGTCNAGVVGNGSAHAAAVIAANGNPPIYLADSAPDALAHRDGERPEAWAGGELDGLPLPGFQFGNSPREVDAMDFSGREIVFGTVNGPRAARMASAAEHVSMAGFLNLTAAAERAAATDPETVRIVCAGSHRVFALDDAVCAGRIAGRLMAMGAVAVPSPRMVTQPE